MTGRIKHQNKSSKMPEQEEKNEKNKQKTKPNVLQITHNSILLFRQTMMEVTKEEKKKDAAVFCLQNKGTTAFSATKSATATV